jgi:hypothetical protein
MLSVARLEAVATEELDRTTPLEQLQEIQAGRPFPLEVSEAFYNTQ